MSTITTKQNTIDVMITAARMYGRRSSRTRLEGYAVISKLLDEVKFNNKESVLGAFKAIANILMNNGLSLEKAYAPIFYFEAQARETGLDPIEWVREELTAELFPQSKHEQSKHEQSKHEQPKHEQSKHEQSKPEQPKPEQSKHEQPKHEQSKHEQPKHEQPKHEQSKPEQPKPEQSKTEQKAEDALSIIDYLDEDEIKKLSGTLNLTLTEDEIKSLMDKVNVLTIGDMRALNMINIDDIVSSSIKEVNAETATTDIVTAVLTKIKEAVNRERVTAVLEDAVAVKLCTAYAASEPFAIGQAPKVVTEEAPKVNKDLEVYDPDPDKTIEEKAAFIKERIKVSEDFESTAFDIKGSSPEKVNMLYNMLTSDELANTLKLKYGFAGTSADIELTAVPPTRYPNQPERYKFAFEIGPKGFKKKAKKRKIVILYNPEPVKASGSITIDRRIGYAEQFTATV